MLNFFLLDKKEVKLKTLTEKDSNLKFFFNAAEGRYLI